jgi:hypothetical protein
MCSARGKFIACDGVRFTTRLLRWFAGLSVAIWLCAPAAACDFAAGAKEFAARAASLRLPGAELVLGTCWGKDSAITDYSVERIADEATWRAVWARHAPGQTTPPVDFATTMVIAIFTGRIPGNISGPQLDSVVEHDKIDLVTQEYFNDVLRGDENNVFLFVELHRATKPVRVTARSYCLVCEPQKSENVLKEFEALNDAK